MYETNDDDDIQYNVRPSFPSAQRTRLHYFNRIRIASSLLQFAHYGVHVYRKKQRENSASSPRACSYYDRDLPTASSCAVCSRIHRRYTRAVCCGHRNSTIFAPEIFRLAFARAPIFPNKAVNTDPPVFVCSSV